MLKNKSIDVRESYAYEDIQGMSQQTDIYTAY
jgi:hypothetical protein